jgi:hypothetical protein
MELTIEVIAFRRLERGTLCGFADITIRELRIKVHEVALHAKGDTRWAAMPSRPSVRDGRVVGGDNGKVQYSPLFEFETRATHSRARSGEQWRRWTRTRSRHDHGAARRVNGLRAPGLCLRPGSEGNLSQSARPAAGRARGDPLEGVSRTSPLSRTHPNSIQTNHISRCATRGPIVSANSSLRSKCQPSASDAGDDPVPNRQSRSEGSGDSSATPGGQHGRREIPGAGTRRICRPTSRTR